MTRGRSIGLAVAIGAIVAAVTALMPHPIRLNGIGVGDIGLPLVGFDQWVHGGSPYNVQLRGNATALYPFTTMLALSPLTLLGVVFAAPVFNGLTSAGLGYAIARHDRPWRFLVFATPCYWSAIHSVQWSPLLMAALLLPALLPFAAVKPQMGLSLLLAGKWTLRTLAFTAAFVLLSVILLPSWPVVWLQMGKLGTYNGRIPLVVIPGFLLVAAALLWRRREGRLLLGLAVTPQRYFYDQLSLFLVPQSLRQMLVLVTASWGVAVLAVAAGWWEISSGEQDARVWIATVIGVYLVALAIAGWNERNARRTAQPS